MYPLVMTNKTDGKITIVDGKAQYIWPFSIAMLNYKRVYIYIIHIIYM